MGSLGRLTRAAVFAGAWLALLGGMVIGEFHHHAGTDSDAHCVVCALSGAPSASPPRAPEPTPPELQPVRPATSPSLRPAVAELRHTSARAPPQA